MYNGSAGVDGAGDIPSKYIGSAGVGASDILLKYNGRSGVEGAGDILSKYNGTAEVKHAGDF